MIGVAGGPEKYRAVVATIGYDECVDRRGADVAGEPDRLCPGGIDVFFDLTGGELLHRACERLSVGARVVLCGMMAEYNSPERMGGSPPALWIKARAIVYGLVVYDYDPRRDEFLEAVTPPVASGEPQVPEDRVHGLAEAPALSCRLMRGENRGRAVVEVASA